jgi:SOS-response transcriptional repressor LexA
MGYFNDQSNARRERIYAFLLDYGQEHQPSPTIREIQAACHISSTSVVNYHLGILETDGRIVRAVDGQSRGIRLTGDEAGLTLHFTPDEAERLRAWGGDDPKGRILAMRGTRIPEAHQPSLSGALESSGGVG